MEKKPIKNKTPKRVYIVGDSIVSVNGYDISRKTEKYLPTPPMLQQVDV